MERTFKDVESRVHVKRMRASVASLVKLSEDLAVLRLGRGVEAMNRETEVFEENMLYAETVTDSSLDSLRQEAMVLQQKIMDHLSKPVL